MSFVCGFEINFKQTHKITKLSLANVLRNTKNKVCLQTPKKCPNNKLMKANRFNFKNENLVYLLFLFTFNV